MDSREERSPYRVNTPYASPTHLGLANIGNTCYMNSTLNSLYFVPQFSSYFATQPKVTSTGLVSKLRIFVSQYGESRISGSLLSDIRDHSPKFPYGSQESAYQFMLSILQTIDKEIGREPSRSSAVVSSWQDELRRSLTSGCRPLREAFSVVIEEKRTCTYCRTVTSKYIYQRSLSLNLVSPRQRGFLSFDSCLEQFLAPKRDSEYASHRCYNAGRTDFMRFRTFCGI